MSDAHSDHDASHDAPHEGPIKTPKQLILAVFFAFVVPIIGIILLVHYVAADQKPSAGSEEGLGPEAVARRIHPVGTVEVKDVNDVSTMKTGEQVFTAQCSACHATGAAGSPKFGDTAAWAPRIAKGFDALLNSALHGKGNMGAQGGGDFSDLEVARAVVYMANKGGASFPEPKAPAAGAATAAAEAPAAAVAAQAASQPATVANAEPAKSEAAAGAVPALYTQTCQTCHAAGIAGAPKLGDKAAWAPRIKQGVDTLVANAIKGKNAMPPKGGSNASEAEIRTVVTYMVNAAK